MSRALPALLLLLLPPFVPAAGATSPAAIGTALVADWHPDANGTYATRDPRRNDDPTFDEYAAAMIGAAQVMSGRRALVSRGVRSLVAACRYPSYMRSFQLLGVAVGYQGLRRQRLLRAYPRSVRHLRTCLVRMRPTASGWSQGRWVGNQQAVDYAAYRIARRNGIDPPRFTAFAATAERVLRRMSRVDGPGDVCIIGDRPWFPLAYHVLTTAAMRLAGRPVACAERALAALQAPNGDGAWSGRSYLQSWTLAAEVYLFRRTGDPMRAARAQIRLERDYVGDGAPRLNPCDCLQDSYAQRPAYTGLTAFFLLLAGDDEPGDPAPAAGGLPLTTPLYVVEATAATWRALRLGGGPPDGRYATGVVREQVLEGNVWRTTTPDLVP